MAGASLSLHDSTDGHDPAVPSDMRRTCGGGDEDASIPVIDFDVLVNGAADQRAQAIRDLGRACEDWGFFMVTNHGVPEDLKEAVMRTCKELFISLPEEEKAEYMEAGRPMDPIRLGSGFNSVVDDAKYCRDYLKMFVHPYLHCPAKPAKLRDVAAEYSLKTRDLLMLLVKAISESLGLDGGRLSQAMDLESCLQILVANHYPPYTGPADKLGLGLPPHSDHGLLNLLFQNGIDGLQVHHEGQWLLAKPLPGAFFVIAGDQLEIVGNGRYKALLHRSVVGGERTRMSIASIISPSLDAMVEPVPELALDGKGVEFRGIMYRDYMEHQQTNKLSGKAALDIPGAACHQRSRELVIEVCYLCFLILLLCSNQQQHDSRVLYGYLKLLRTTMDAKLNLEHLIS